MFRDLKEYQEIQSIYEKSVCISDEERELLKYLEEQDFTEEELLTLSENTEEVVRIVVEELLADEEVLQEQNISKEELIEGLLGVTAKATGKLLPKAAAGLKRAFSNPALRKGVKGVVKGSKQAIKNTATKVKAGLGALAKGGKDKAAAASSAIKDKSKAVASSPIVKGVGKALKSTVPVAAAGGIGGVIGAKLAGAGNKKTEGGTTEKTDVDKGGSKGGGDSTSSSGGGAGSKSGTSFANAIKLNTPTKNTSTTTTTTTTSSGEKKMGAIEKKNRERFGDKRIDFLKQKQKDFKSMDRAKFREKYPNSQSAKDAKRNKSPMDMRNESLQIANELASVYQKMYQTPSEESLTEDVKNYNALVDFIIKENIVSTVEEADAIIAEIDEQLIESYLIEGVISEGLMDAVNRVKQGVGSAVKKVGDATGGAINKAKEVVGKKINQTKNLVTKTLNPVSDENKKIRSKTAELKKTDKFNSDTGEQGKLKSQISAVKRQRDGKSIADVQAANKQSMQDRARKKNEAFQKKKEEFRRKKMGEEIEKDAYTTVLEYLLSQNHAATIEEANYIMTELDAETIQGIISES